MRITNRIFLSFGRVCAESYNRTYIRMCSIYEKPSRFHTHVYNIRVYIIRVLYNTHYTALMSITIFFSPA